MLCGWLACYLCCSQLYVIMCALHVKPLRLRLCSVALAALHCHKMTLCFTTKCLELAVYGCLMQASAQLHSATTSWSPSSSSSQPNQRLRDFSVTRKLLDSAQHPQRDVVTVVRSREDLAAALDNQAAHIEIQAHMNLSDWYWNGKYSDWSVLEVPGTVRSITVCFTCHHPLHFSTCLAVSGTANITVNTLLPKGLPIRQENVFVSLPHLRFQITHAPKLISKWYYKDDCTGKLHRGATVLTDAVNRLLAARFGPQKARAMHHTVRGCSTAWRAPSRLAFCERSQCPCTLDAQSDAQKAGIDVAVHVCSS